jgi:flavin reductase (DIM6/NTAB) family NADH-FMN oxidoreductase RutF
MMKISGDLATALASLTTGIYVLTVADGDRRHGMSSSWVNQVSGDPPLFSAAVDQQHFSHAIITKTRSFALNIVGSRGRQLEDYFYSERARRPDNLAGIDCELSPRLRLPWLSDAMVSIEAQVVSSLAAGDHTIFIAEPVGVRVRPSDRPLTSLDLDYVYLGGKTVVRRAREGKGEVKRAAPS